MTQTGYGPLSTPTAPWRKVVPLVLAAVATPAAGITAFFAAITWSGCFLSCSGTDHTGGALLGLLALGLLLLGPVTAALLTRTWRWPGAAFLSGVLSCVVLTGGAGLG